MKKLSKPRYILCSFILIFAILLVISCNNRDKQIYTPFFEDKSLQTESTIDFNLIDNLNESNKKTIDLATILFNRTKDLKSLQLLLKIKKDHYKIDSELRKLTAKNLIIIPRAVYDLNIKSDSLKNKKANLYLFALLDKEIKNMATILDQIKKTAQNDDFIQFAAHSKKRIESNIHIVQTNIALQ